MSRIHVIVDAAQKVRYQSQAAREGKSLGAWLREAADERLARSVPPRFTSFEEFDTFIAECQRRSAADGGPDREPDWEETKRIILDAKTRGLGEFL